MKNIIIKNKIINLFLLFTIALFTSCEDTLDVKPKSSYYKENFYKTVNHADLAVKGIYDVLSVKTTYSLMLAMAAPMDNDISYMRGIGFSNALRQVCHYGVKPTTGWIGDTWFYLYSGINRANEAIENIQNMDLYKNGTEEEKAKLNHYLGEAKFLRAFLYFDLVRLWGDVPLRTKPSKDSDNFFVSRNNRNEVYDLIISDLKEAKELVPLDESINNDRANQGAIRGYLIRVLLYKAGYYLSQETKTMTRIDDYKEYYKQAIQEAKELQELGEYRLITKEEGGYKTVFTNLTSFIQNPKENLFEIAFYNLSHGTEDSGTIGTWNSPKTDKKSPYGRANAYVLARPDFIEEFSAEDKRKDVAVANFTVNKKGQRKPLKKGKPMYPGKWCRDVIAEPPQNPNNTNVNWCTLRYADVLLMMAEAINEVRDDLPAGVSLQDGFDAINDVRERAGLADLPNTLSKEEMFEAIQLERKKELCFEGWRKFDLIRWNRLGSELRKAQDELNAKYPKDNTYKNSVGYMAGKTFVDNKNELLPIPQREIDENKNLTQNPNY